MRVDANQLSSYHHGIMVCINKDGWGATWDTSAFVWTDSRRGMVQKFDLGEVDHALKGFSDAVRVGRFAYLSPFASDPHTYTSRLVRISLGNTSIVDTFNEVGAVFRSMVTVLDLAQKDPQLTGFSGLFNSGKYLYLVPYRSKHEPKNGQRGSGKMPRVDLNIFDLPGIDVTDMAKSNRNQIPSFPDEDLRGFSGGFAS